MCTRCVRFTREITQTDELQVDAPGQPRRDRRLPRPPLDNPLAGNVVDLCPVGALLDKDFLHKQRYWFLSTARLGLHPLLDRLQHQRRGEPGPDLADQAAEQPPGQRLLDLRRGPRTATRPANDPDLLAGMYVREGGRPPGRPQSTRPSRPSTAGSSRSAAEGKTIAGVALAVPDGRGGLPDGLLPQGARARRACWPWGRCRSRGDDRDLRARPDAKGRTGRHQLRRPPAVHDPRREVPERQRRRRRSWSTSRGR